MSRSEHQSVAVRNSDINPWYALGICRRTHNLTTPLRLQFFVAPGMVEVMVGI
jgi:hypothetical protein